MQFGQSSVEAEKCMNKPYYSFLNYTQNNFITVLSNFTFLLRIIVHYLFSVFLHPKFPNIFELNWIKKVGKMKTKRQVRQEVGAGTMRLCVRKTRRRAAKIICIGLLCSLVYMYMYRSLFFLL